MEINGDGLRRSTRYWTHRLAEENPDKYIIGKGAKKFKKDSRTWLHKSSKNFKLKSDVLPEAQPTLDQDDFSSNGSETIKTIEGELQTTGVVTVHGKNVIKGNNHTLSSSVTGDEEELEHIEDLKNTKDCRQAELNIVNAKQAVNECLHDAANVIQKDVIKAKAMAMQGISLIAEHAGSCEAVERHTGVAKCEEKSRGVTLSDSELCLRAKNLALVCATTDNIGAKTVSNEVVSRPNSVSPKTQMQCISAIDSNSSQEKNTNKTVTKTLKKLTLQGRRKLQSNKVLSATRKSRVPKTCTIVRKPISAKSTKDMRKSFCLASAHRQKRRQSSGAGKIRQRITFIMKCGDKRRLSNKDTKTLIACKASAKHRKLKCRENGDRAEAGKVMIQKRRIIKDGNLIKKVNPSRATDVKAAKTASGKLQGEGHSAEDKLHRKRQSTSPLPEVGCRSSKSTVIESDRCISPVPKLPEERKRKGSLPPNKSTSVDSIQEKRSRDSLAEDIKVFLRDRRPPRYKPMDTTLSSGTVQSASECSLQVQCSLTAESLLDTDSCPSSTQVEQGSVSSSAVSTPTGVHSRHSLTDSDSVVHQDEVHHDNHFALTPSPGNHCLPTINIADLNDNLDSKMIGSAYVLHRTVRKQLLKRESWEHVSKSDSSLEN